MCGIFRLGLMVFQGGCISMCGWSRLQFEFDSWFFAVGLKLSAFACDMLLRFG